MLKRKWMFVFTATFRGIEAENSITVVPGGNLTADVETKSGYPSVDDVNRATAYQKKAIGKQVQPPQFVDVECVGFYPLDLPSEE